MRSKKILVLSHCVLNQNAVIADWERARGAFPFVAQHLAQGVGIVQLPCPELLHGGLSRPPMSYAQYNTPAYRALCAELCVPIVAQLVEYARCGYELCGLIGIEQSPTCSISGQRGVLMEELLAALDAARLSLPLYEMPECWTFSEHRDQTLLT